MKHILALAFSALALGACVETAPPPLANDHPGNPRAASGLIEIPTTVSGYRSADDLAARARQDSAPAPMIHGATGHGGHSPAPTPQPGGHSHE